MIYAIGDIHGQFQMMHALMENLQEKHGLTNQDDLVFIGDYIDRGPQSSEVIETLIGYRTIWGDKAHFLRGNHEQLLLDAEEQEQPFAIAHNAWAVSQQTGSWLRNGGFDTLKSYGLKPHDVHNQWADAIPGPHWEFIRSTEMEWVTDSFHFVHAGLVPKEYVWTTEHFDKPAESRLWIREPFLSSTENFGKRVVFGHTIQRNGMPDIQPNKIGIDTGAFLPNGRLTCLICSEALGNSILEFVQIDGRGKFHHYRIEIPVPA